MPSHAIKIGKFYHAQNGATEHHTLNYSAEEFADLNLKGGVEVDASLIRVEEGIMLLIQGVKATQITPCAQCGKSLEIPYEMDSSEWLFYESKPLIYDDENESLFFDKQAMELDPTEPVRQELILNEKILARCPKACKKFKEAPEQAPKALAGLKDLIQ
ncbi:hypothetical protein IPG41_06905 [Candidatus Peregrinibacteria bacterium]|nr:MAG: hypothetical protein IPG41_06905 [Candidatus Peregrinibacteria bacterium]